MIESKPTIIQVVQLPADFQPLFVSAAHVDRVVIGVSKKTWANWRSAKTGPRFYMVGAKPYYRLKDLQDYFSANPVETTK